MTAINKPVFEKDKIRMYAYNGACFNPFCPSESDVDINIIAHSLANQCRFNGLCSDFYSVAQHCVLVSEYIVNYILHTDRNGSDRFQDLSDERTFMWEFAMAGLLHDASEAFIVDIPRPIKNSEIFKEYICLENEWMRCVSLHFNVDFNRFDSEIVKGADDAVLMVEARDLMGGACSIPMGAIDSLLEPYISPVGPKEAKKMFLDRYYTVRNTIKRKSGGRLHP